MGARNRDEDRWYRVDATAPQFAAFLASAADRHKGRESAAELSVNMKRDGSEALIKVRGAAVIVSPAILRVFTAADHHEAVSLVRDEAWEPTGLDT